MPGWIIPLITPGTFRLVPPDDQLPEWKADYRAMLGPMFFGETPSFEEMMKLVAGFEEQFNQTGGAAERSL